MIVTDERYVYHVSGQLSLPGVAPLLCAGITTYSPLKFAGVKAGDKVAIAGLGGLGHMAVKLPWQWVPKLPCSALHLQGSRCQKLGAHHFVLSTDAEAMAKLDSRFDVVVDAISASHDYEIYLKLLALHGKLLVVGLPSKQPQVNPLNSSKTGEALLVP